MTLANETAVSLRNTNRFFIGGEWVEPSSGAMIRVVDSTNEEVFLSVAEAREADMSRAVTAARQAFDRGPWPRMSHHERAGYLRAMAAGLMRAKLRLGAGVAPRVGRALLDGTVRRDGSRRYLRLLRWPG